MGLSEAELSRFYGPPCRGDYVAVVTPWRYLFRPIRVTVHRLVAPVLEVACLEAAAVSLWRPKRFEGFVCRGNRLNPHSPSRHARGLAVDAFTTPPWMPPPGGVRTPNDQMPRSFYECFTRRGFTWGGTFSNRDTPHLEWDRPPPGPVVIPPAHPIEEELVFITDPTKPEKVNGFTPGARLDVANRQVLLYNGSSVRDDQLVKHGGAKREREIRARHCAEPDPVAIGPYSKGVRVCYADGQTEDMGWS